MKKMLSLFLAVLMLAAVVSLSACGKVEPLKITVIINTAEENARGQKVVVEEILKAEYDYTSSTPNISDLLLKLKDDGKINLETKTEGETVTVTGINGLVPKTEVGDTKLENYDWYVYVDGAAVVDDGLVSTVAVAAGNTITFTYMHYSFDKDS